MLGDAGLRPILVALRGCTHLRSFHCSRNGLTPVFARSELLPAVAANTSLRELKADGIPGNAVFPPIPDLARAEALVAARPRVG